MEDVYEAVVATAPDARFGLAFSDSSDACLIRADGNDPILRDTAIRNAHARAAGHVFVLITKDAHPTNVLDPIRNVRDVCSIFCATANPVEVVLACSEHGNGVLGVIDGHPLKGIGRMRK